MEIPHEFIPSVGKKPIPTGEDHFGALRRSADILTDGDALRNRLADDGYLYFPGALDRDQVTSARRVCMERLMAQGALEAGSDPMDAIAAHGTKKYYFMESLAEENDPLMRVLYEGAMMRLMAQLFDTDVRHFDYTWMRAVGPGNGTSPHCDAVYMNRGTEQLITAWTPLGDIPLVQGGLVVLENSHREKTGKLEQYLHQDVDTFCENGPNAQKIRDGKMAWEHYDGSFREWSGAFSDDANEIRASLGGRWLTSPEYRMGDVLLFTIATLHASLDNNSDRIRLSSDTRYQPAHLPADERWVLGANGERPIAHGAAGKRGKIC